MQSNVSNEIHTQDRVVTELVLHAYIHLYGIRGAVIRAKHLDAVEVVPLKCGPNEVWVGRWSRRSDGRLISRLIGGNLRSCKADSFATVRNARTSLTVRYSGYWTRRASTEARRRLS